MLPTLGFGRLVELVTRPDPSLAVAGARASTFPSPFGVAAGFDKDARAVRGLGQLGFGHVEVGTHHRRRRSPATRARACSGSSPTARVVNRMGFNNGGADAAVGRLSRLARRTAPPGARREHRQEPGRRRRGRGRRLRAQRHGARAARRLPRRERELAEHARPARAAGARRPRARCSRRCAPRRATHAAPREDRARPRRRGGRAHLRARHAARPRRHHRHEHHDLARGTAHAGIRGRSASGRAASRARRSRPARSRCCASCARTCRRSSA